MTYETTCPVCGGKVIVEYYTEDSVGVVEEYGNCTRCNYSTEFAYGSYGVYFGKHEFTYSCSIFDNNNERARLFTKMRRAEFMAKRNWRKGLRKNYRRIK